MTLYQKFDQFINEFNNRVGQPSPLFFKTLRSIFGWITTISGLLLAVQALPQVHVPEWLTVVNTIFLSITTSAWGMTHLPVQDPQKEEPSQ